jgi:hypothetical protein
MADFTENHTVLFSGFKTNKKKVRKTRKLESIHEKRSVELKTESKKLDKNLCRRRLEFKPSFGLLLPLCSLTYSVDDQREPIGFHAPITHILF